MLRLLSPLALAAAALALSVPTPPPKLDKRQLLGIPGLSLPGLGAGGDPLTGLGGLLPSGLLPSNAAGLESIFQSFSSELVNGAGGIAQLLGPLVCDITLLESAVTSLESLLVTGIPVLGTALGSPLTALINPILSDLEHAITMPPITCHSTSALPTSTVPSTVQTTTTTTSAAAAPTTTSTNTIVVTVTSTSPTATVQNTQTNTVTQTDCDCITTVHPTTSWVTITTVAPCPYQVTTQACPVCDQTTIWQTSYTPTVYSSCSTYQTTYQVPTNTWGGGGGGGGQYTYQGGEQTVAPAANTYNFNTYGSGATDGGIDTADVGFDTATYGSGSGYTYGGDSGSNQTYAFNTATLGGYNPATAGTDNVYTTVYVSPNSKATLLTMPTLLIGGSIALFGLCFML